MLSVYTVDLGRFKTRVRISTQSMLEKEAGKSCYVKVSNIGVNAGIIPMIHRRNQEKKRPVVGRDETRLAASR